MLAEGRRRDGSGGDGGGGSSSSSSSSSSNGSVPKLEIQVLRKINSSNNSHI
jgi:hypothetical protein